MSSAVPSVLRPFFSHVHELSDLLPADTTSDLSNEFSTFLSKVYVASQEEVQLAPSPDRNVSTVINMVAVAQERIQVLHSVARSKVPANQYSKLPKNCLTLSRNLAKDATIDQLPANWAVRSLCTDPNWQTLLNAIGSRAFSKLLALPDAAMFVRLQNGGLGQVTGTPLIDLQPLPIARKAKPTTATRSRAGRRSRKRSYQEAEGDRSDADADPQPQRDSVLPSANAHPEPLQDPVDPLAAADAESEQDSVNARPAKKRRLATEGRRTSEVYIQRQRIFYGKPSIGSGRILFRGLPKHNVVRRAQKAMRDDTAESFQVAARHLAKHVFARQYKLPNAWSWEQSPFEPFQTFENLDGAIKERGRIATPARLRFVLAELEKLIRLDAKMPYLKTVRVYCPRPDRERPEETSPISAVTTRSTAQIRTQASRSSVPAAAPIASSSEAAESALPKPQEQSLMSFATPTWQVIRYIRICVHATIPRDLIGDAKNWAALDDAISVFVKGGRYDTLSVHRLIQDISPTSIPWIHRSRSQGSQQQDLLEDLVFWIFNTFIIDLIRATFFVTDAAHTGVQSHYFRHDVWDKVTRSEYERLISSNYEIVPVSQRQPPGKDGAAPTLRLAPKKTGTRPIVNLKYRARSVQSNGQTKLLRSVNSLLSPAFDALNHTKVTRPDSLRASLFGQSAIAATLKGFATRVRDGTSDVPPRILIVKVDVKKCFDTIPQRKLMEVVERILTDDSYSSRKYAKLTPFKSRSSKRWLRHTVNIRDMLDVNDVANASGRKGRGSAFVDLASGESTSREGVLDLIRRHVRDHRIIVKGEEYRQVSGIAQGSVLSSLLCAFFYADLERERLADLLCGDDAALLRVTDDSLFVTTDASKAREFLARMDAGFEEWGCRTSPDKTLTNFDADLAPGVGARRSTSHLFPYCGLLVDDRTLDCYIDPSRAKHSNAVRNVTRPSSARGKYFVAKALNLAKRGNGTSTTACADEFERSRRLLLHFSVLATKLAAQATKNLSHDSDALFIQTLFDCLRAVAKQAKRQGMARLRKLSIDRLRVYSIGLQAFESVLARRSGRFGAVLREVRNELRKRKYALHVRASAKAIRRAIRDFDL